MKEKWLFFFFCIIPLCEDHMQCSKPPLPSWRGIQEGIKNRGEKLNSFYLGASKKEKDKIKSGLRENLREPESVLD